MLSATAQPLAGGIRPGDVVSEIDQRAVGSAKAAVDALKAAKQSGRNSVLPLSAQGKPCALSPCR